jgi:hypothetical protein
MTNSAPKAAPNRTGLRMMTLFSAWHKRLRSLPDYGHFPGILVCCRDAARTLHAATLELA